MPLNEEPANEDSRSKEVIRTIKTDQTGIAESSIVQKKK